MKRDIYTDLLFDVLVLFLILNFGLKSSCGIPIFTWCFVYFVILALRSLSNLAKIYIARNLPRYHNFYALASFVIMDGILLIWLIYGNIIFYSPENDCNTIEGSKVIFNLMFVLLMIGYFQMFVYALLIFCMPCLIYVLR